MSTQHQDCNVTVQPSSSPLLYTVIMTQPVSTSPFDSLSQSNIPVAPSISFNNNNTLDPIHTIILQKQAELNDAKEYRYNVLLDQYNSKCQSYDELQSRYHMLQSDFTYNIQLIQSHENELNMYERQINEKNNTVDELNSYINELDSKYKIVHHKQQSCATELHTIKLQYESTIQQQSVELNEKLNNIKIEYSNKTDVLYKQVDDLTNELSIQKSDYTDRYNTLEMEYQIKLKDKQYIIDELQNDIHAMKIELDSLQHTICDNNAVIVQLSNDKLQLQQSIDHNNSKTVLNEYEFRLNDTVNKLHELQQQLADEQQQHRDTINTINVSHQHEIDSLQSHITHLQSITQNNDNEMNRLMSELDQMKSNESDRYCKLQADYEQLQSDAQHTVVDFTQQINEHEQNIQLLHNKLQQSQLTIDEQYNEITSHKQRYKTIEQKYDESQRKVQEYKYDSTQKYDTYDSAILNLQQYNNDLQNRLDSIISDRTMIEKKHNILASKISGYQSQLASTRAELLTLRNEYNILLLSRNNHTQPSTVRSNISQHLQQPATSRIQQSNSNSSPPPPLTPIGERLSIISPGQTARMVAQHDEYHTATVSTSSPPSNTISIQPIQSVSEDNISSNIPTHARADTNTVLTMSLPTRPDTIPGSTLVDINNALNIPSKPKHQRKRSKSRYAIRSSAISTFDEPNDDNDNTIINSNNTNTQNHAHRIESTDMTELTADDEFGAIFEPIERVSHVRHTSLNSVPTAAINSRSVTQPHTPHNDDEKNENNNSYKRNHRSNTAFIVPNSRRGTLNLQAELVENIELNHNSLLNDIHSVPEENNGNVSNDNMYLKGPINLDIPDNTISDQLYSDSNTQSQRITPRSEQIQPRRIVGNNAVQAQTPIQSNTNEQSHQQTYSYPTNNYQQVQHTQSVHDNQPDTYQPAECVQSTQPAQSNQSQSTYKNNQYIEPDSTATTLSINESTEQQIIRLTNENSLLKQQNQQIQHVISSMRNEMQNLMTSTINHSSADNTTHIYTLQQSISQLQQHNNDLQYKLNKLHEHNTLLTSKVTQLTQHINNINNSTSVIDVPMIDDSEATFLREYVKQVHDTVDTTRIELNQLKHEADTEYDRYKQHLSTLKSTQQQLVQQIQQYKQYCDTLDVKQLQLQKSNHELLQSNTDYLNQCNTLQEMLNKLRREREKLLEISNELRNDLHHAVHKINNSELSTARSDYMVVHDNSQNNSNHNHHGDVSVRQTKQGILMVDGSGKYLHDDEADIHIPSKQISSTTQQHKSRSRKHSNDKVKSNNNNKSNYNDDVELTSQPISTHTRPSTTKNTDRITASQRNVIERLKSQNNNRSDSVNQRLAQLQQLKDNIRKNAGLQ